MVQDFLKPGELLEEDGLQQVLHLAGEGELLVQFGHLLLHLLPELADVVLAEELEVGVSGAVLLVEGHEGRQQADQDFPAGEHAFPQAFGLALGAHFRPAADPQLALFGEEKVGGQQVRVDERRLEFGEAVQGFDQIFEEGPRHLFAHLAVARQVVVEVAPGGLAHDDQVAALQRLCAGGVEGGPVVKHPQNGRVLRAQQAAQLRLVIDEGVGREELDDHGLRVVQEAVNAEWSGRYSCVVSFFIRWQEAKS